MQESTNKTKDKANRIINDFKKFEETWIEEICNKYHITIKELYDNFEIRRYVFIVNQIFSSSVGFYIYLKPIHIHDNYLWYIDHNLGNFIKKQKLLLYE